MALCAVYFRHFSSLYFAMLPISGSLSFPSASMPVRRGPWRVLVDRNWGAKFSKSGSEVFMKVYPPSASHSSSSLPTLVSLGLFSTRSFFIPHLVVPFFSFSPLPLHPRCLTFALFFPPSASPFVWPTLSHPLFLPSGSYRGRTERVNPRSPSAGLAQKPGCTSSFPRFCPQPVSQVSLPLRSRLISIRYRDSRSPVDRT